MAKDIFCPDTLSCFRCKIDNACKYHIVEISFKLWFIFWHIIFINPLRLHFLNFPQYFPSLKKTHIGVIKQQWRFDKLWNLQCFGWDIVVYCQVIKFKKKIEKGSLFQLVWDISVSWCKSYVTASSMERCLICTNQLAWLFVSICLDLYSIFISSILMHLQGSFCVCTQPMRNDVTLYCYLSLAGRINKMILVYSA